MKIVIFAIMQTNARIAISQLARTALKNASTDAVFFTATTA